MSSECTSDTPPLVWTGALACDSLFRHPFQHWLKQTSNIFIHSEEGTQVRTQGATLPQTPLPLPHHMPSLPHLCLSPKLPFSHFPSPPPPSVLHSLSVVLGRRCKGLCLASPRGSPWSGEQAQIMCTGFLDVAIDVNSCDFVCVCKYVHMCACGCMLFEALTFLSPAASTSTCRVWTRVSHALQSHHQLPVSWNRL